MSQVEFTKRWQAEKDMYKAWGDHVTATILADLAKMNLPKSVDEFIQIPPKARVKTDSSLLEKAFYRPEKTYNDPYSQITDKVGTRFVVLLERDIEVLCKAVEQNESWRASKDKDFEQERDVTPDVFSYQSVHFVVTASADIQVGEIVVKAGTPCEVQLRTLLQHAHSQLTHDTIYKPKTNASSQTKRFVARSMALIETVDNFFLQVMKEIEKAGEPLRQAMDILASTFEKAVGRTPVASKLNTFVLDAFEDKLSSISPEVLIEFLKTKSYIPEKIAKRADESLLFRQPAVLLIYFLANQHPNETKKRWPLTPGELQLIYEDLGFSYEKQ